MNKFFVETFNKIKSAWLSWKMPQKLIFGGVIIVAVGSIATLATVNSTPGLVPVFGAAITDTTLRDRITTRLDEEGIGYVLTNENQIINVADFKTARKARAILLREDLAPTNIDPWQIFDIDRWTTSDFLNNVNLQRSITQQLKLHIESLDDIDLAQVNLAVPKKQLFTDEQDPTTVSVIITPKPGSDIASNKKKLKGLVNLIKHAVPNMKDENITLADNYGNQLNDFSGMDAADRLAEIERLDKIKKEQQRYYLNLFRESLAGIISPDRVRVLNVEITNNTDIYRATGRRITPIEITPQDPTKPYTTRETVQNILVEEQKGLVGFQGTGFNPQGPAGQEGQTPPAYQDLQNTTGRYSQETNTSVYTNNEENYIRENAPLKRENIAVSVAIDGTWRFETDEKGAYLFENDAITRRRIFVPVSDDELKKYLELVKTAVGFNLARGDQVTVQNIAFDRRAEHAAEEAAYRKQLMMSNITRFALIGLVALITLFFVVRFFIKESERRRREREEALARQHQAMREAALRSLEAEGSEPEMSAGDKHRVELHNHALNVAREHPEDVALLIRTWLSEEQ